MLTPAHARSHLLAVVVAKRFNLQLRRNGTKGFTKAHYIWKALEWQKSSHICCVQELKNVSMVKILFV